MSVLLLGDAGWAEEKGDGSFVMQIRGTVAEVDARRLGEWLVRSTTARRSEAERETPAD